MRKLSQLFLVACIFVFACTKIETTTIGNGLIPPVDGVTTLDTTIEVLTDNFIDTLSESLRIYKSDQQVIGIINNDPLFGKTRASLFVEIKPESYKYYLQGTKQTRTVDSAVLILSYSGVYGDTTIPQNWEVKEVTEPIDPDSIYTKKQTFSTGAVLNSANVGKPLELVKLNDSISTPTEKAINQVRLKLDFSVAEKFINQFDSTENGAYFNDSIFRERFRGFSIAPTNSSPGNALVQVNLADTNTKLALFYKYKNTAGSDTSVVNFLRFSSGSGVPVSGSADHIVRDRAGSDFDLDLLKQETNTQYVYVQTAPGSYSTITIPGLENVSNRIVHRAELMMIQDYDESKLDQFFTPPSFVLLSSFNTNKNVKVNVPNDFIIDQNSSINKATFGGTYVQRVLTSGEAVRGYFFDVTRYVQGVLTRRDPNLKLRITSPVNDSLAYSAPYPNTTIPISYNMFSSGTNPPAVGRIRLFGGKNITHPLRMRLRIIYSRL